MPNYLCYMTVLLNANWYILNRITRATQKLAVAYQSLMRFWALLILWTASRSFAIVRMPISSFAEEAATRAITARMNESKLQLCVFGQGRKAKLSLKRLLLNLNNKKLWEQGKVQSLFPHCRPETSNKLSYGNNKKSEKAPLHLALDPKQHSLALCYEGTTPDLSGSGSSNSELVCSL